MKDRELDIVLWGATGFTGPLVAAHLLQRYGADRELRWALGGRSSQKLEAVRQQLVRECGSAAAANLPLVLADSDDEASLEAMVRRTRVVCSTVGPYARYGSKLVAACARLGIDYCDLTGEVQWIRRMIDAHESTAQSSGARIVHTCGFDSIPSDLGVFFVQRAMKERHGCAATRVKYRVKSMSGGFSGGTAASMVNIMEEMAANPEVRRIVADPYALNPPGDRRGPDGRDQVGVAYDADFDSWTAPFVMAGINTRVVRRTNALLQHAYGADFRYDEAMLMGGGPTGWMKAAGLTAALGSVLVAGAVPPLRRALASFLPAPGQGPSAHERETGSFDIRLFAQHPSDATKNLRARVTGDRDPGYGSTSKMLGESAVCLARDPLAAGGGISTPAAAMGDALLTRLQASAGLTFTVE